MSENARRDLLRKTATLGIGVMASSGNLLFRADRILNQVNRNLTTAEFFPEFKQVTTKTSGATINFVTAGNGPPLLLLHGYPQTHLMWRKIAPQLARNFTVVAPDLRGYGDSSKPTEGENHIGYSKRAMAQDQVEVMASLGFERFAVIGHDRAEAVRHSGRVRVHRAYEDAGHAEC